ncbi:MAG: MjaI family restriction endonuclease [bacterium]
MRIKIPNKEVVELLNAPIIEFDKYVSPLINFANFYAGGTKPKIVGQMSELIQEFTGKNVSEWEKWYVEQYPDAMKNATDIIYEKIVELKRILNGIDKSTIEDWVRDLVIVKTFMGLRFQEAILRKIALQKKCDYRLAEPPEEASGIDGFIGGSAVSIKPETYKTKGMLPESIVDMIIYYRKEKTGIVIEFENS